MRIVFQIHITGHVFTGLQYIFLTKIHPTIHLPQRFESHCDRPHSHLCRQKPRLNSFTSLLNPLKRISHSTLNSSVFIMIGRILPPAGNHSDGGAG